MMFTIDRIKSGLRRRAETGWKALRGWLPGRPRPAILMYHRIARERFDPWGTAVAPERFAEHLRWLGRNRTVLSLGEFAQLHRRGMLPADAIAVTLDDGYACNAQVAAPLLDRFAVPATMFLPVELVEKGEPFWWDVVEEIVLAHDGPSLLVNGREIALGVKNAGDRDWKYGKEPRTPRQVAFRQVWKALWERPAEIPASVEALRSQAGPVTPADPNKRPMSPAEAKAAASAMVEFGSHALTHPWLASLPPSEQKREIADSRARCAALTGAIPDAFAYPYGNMDAFLERLVGEAGFACACSTEPTPVEPESRPLALPRIQVGDWSAARLGRALAAA